MRAVCDVQVAGCLLENGSSGTYNVYESTDDKHNCMAFLDISIIYTRTLRCNNLTCGMVRRDVFGVRYPSDRFYGSRESPLSCVNTVENGWLLIVPPFVWVCPFGFVSNSFRLCFKGTTQQRLLLIGFEGGRETHVLGGEAQTIPLKPTNNDH